jgi:TonB family protein
MFRQLSNRGRREKVALALSLMMHCLLLGWLLRPPKPIFIAPFSARAGSNGRATTYIYWPTKEGAAEARTSVAKDRLTWTGAERTKVPKRELQLANLPETAEANTSTIPNTAQAAGSVYGSSLTGSTSGEEVRPALRVTGSEPIVDRDDFGGLEGNVVVEITIDERGNIVQKTLLTSLNPQVDQKVLAALEDWRFLPATRDGVAIPSKEDVYYHFPIRR